MTVPAPGLAGRYGRRVRTPELPMAFTWGEFARGAGFAWLVFQLVFPLSYPVMSLGSFLLYPPSSGSTDVLVFALLGSVMMFVFALPWSIGALVMVGGPTAWLLGLALRRVRPIWVHLIAFAVLGAVVGGATAWTAGAVMTGSASSFGYTLPGALVTGASVAYGWRRTARRALADDALFIEQAASSPPSDGLDTLRYSPDGGDP
ncbi:hypothetical protein [Agromyces neolithicus]|uniref:Uncharacterized protein n=1 Tax=Agromyces neolithicus TaxID=269420 RepID=A0ABN2M433_9MICO